MSIDMQMVHNNQTTLKIIVKLLKCEKRYKWQS